MPVRPDETDLFSRILKADKGPGSEIDLRPACLKLGSLRVHFLVQKWCEEGLVDYDRHWYLVKLTEAGRLPEGDQ